MLLLFFFPAHKLFSLDKSYYIKSKGICQDGTDIEV